MQPRKLPRAENATGASCRRGGPSAPPTFFRETGKLALAIILGMAVGHVLSSGVEWVMIP